MESEIPGDKKGFLENVRRLAKIYHVRISDIITSGDDLYISYRYDDERDFNKFVAELRKVDKQFEVFPIDENKSKIYKV